MIEAKTDKGKGRPPDGDNLGRSLASGEREETCQTDQPVTANTAKEDLVPFWGDGLGCGEGNDFGLVYCTAEGATISAENACDEERACEVAPESYEPVYEHLERVESAVQDGDCSVLRGSVSGHVASFRHKNLP